MMLTFRLMSGYNHRSIRYLLAVLASSGGSVWVSLQEQAPSKSVTICSVFCLGEPMSQAAYCTCVYTIGVVINMSADVINITRLWLCIVVFVECVGILKVVFNTEEKREKGIDELRRGVFNTAVCATYQRLEPTSIL
ncbi:hypothetical protein DL89DRAFT_76168 [Linderina pennispora]|uniref:Uncharacterized protein n=1 Tax=Linderina pennispora TaxID=61395 RepID=A0A1Y1VYH2_9FUNG|nr:uncharacterized protein DL89DRAFT_76168 [Linderina pennispora]ORX66056.1 hypothetical protein DL89DRAFT_76168 [Linderina pennispora]